MPHLFFATPFCARISILSTVFSASRAAVFRTGHLRRRRNITTTDASNGLDAPLGGETVGGREIPEGVGAVADKESNQPVVTAPPSPSFVSPSIPAIAKDIKKVVQKTSVTFAPRASTASKNPAVPGSTLYTVFEVQGYASMLVGGALSFNLIFPSNEPDLWRLMGMWSIWMFTIPSLRARDCSKNEKEALNYLFLLVPLLNVIIPIFWKSFALVWSADTLAFFVMYAWKMGWIERAE